MNTIKLYLAESGRIANLKKDFPLYQGQFQNKLLNVYVPTSILAPKFTIQETGNTIADYVSSTAVKIGMTYTALNGTIKVSKNYYMRFLKTLTYQGIEYALYERKLPQEFTFYAGQGANAPILIANVVNILNDGTTPQIISITTSQTCSLEVMPSTYLDKDEVVEPSELEDLYAQLNSIIGILPTKQNATDDNLQTENKTIVGAINENKGKIDINTSNIAKNQENISKTQEEIASIKENFASAENYIGQLKGNSLPSNVQLSQFVRENTLPSREPKNGDVVIFVLEIVGATDKNYKYIYSVNNWNGYEIPPLESASNGTLGIVKGTYGTGLNNDILIDIVGGEILHIYLKDKMGHYRSLVEYLNATETDIADIVDGNTIVGEAMKSLEDGLGNNIVNTYLTKTLGATKDFVKDYALPRAFNDVYFVSSSGFIKKVPTTPISGVQFQVNSSFVGDIRLFQIEQEINADFELSSKNGYSNNIYIATNQDEKFAFRLLTEYKKQGQDWEYLNVELSNPISFTSNTIEKVTFGGNFLSLADSVISLTNGDKIRQTLEVIKAISGNATFDIYSNDIYPSTFNLTTQSYVLSEIEQVLGKTILLGANGTIQANRVIFTIENADSYIEYRTNQREFLLTALLPIVGELDDSLLVAIEFGDTVYNLYSFMSGGATPLTIGDLKSVMSYSTNIGYSFYPKLIFIETSDIVGFVLSQNTITARQLKEIIKGSSLDASGTKLVLSGGGSGANVEIDSELSTESENAVQNKVITEALDKKLEEEDLTNYVKNTDYASVSNFGVVKLVQYGGLAKTTNNTLYVTGANKHNIDGRVPNQLTSDVSQAPSQNNSRPIVPSTFDYAWKDAFINGFTKLATNTTLYDGRFAWTDDEKATARANLGITSGGTKFYAHKFYKDFDVYTIISTSPNVQYAYFSNGDDPDTGVSNANFGRIINTGYILDAYKEIEDISYMEPQLVKSAEGYKTDIRTFLLGYTERYVNGIYELAGENVSSIFSEDYYGPPLESGMWEDYTGTEFEHIPNIKVIKPNYTSEL